MSGIFSLLMIEQIAGQSCVSTNINGTVISRDCSNICDTIRLQIPHLKAPSDYSLVQIPYAPYPYSTITGSIDFALYSDDKFSSLINMPFAFCFYDSSFSQVVVGSNGLMTFEKNLAGCDNAYVINQPLPYGGTFNCNSISPAYYPRSSIMAAFSDLDPRTNASPSTRKIQWETIGTAPCRKFVVSYYHIGVFGVSAGSCPAPSNTFQMVIHESTGLIEFFFLQKSCASSTNSGRGVFGIQNWNRDKWVTDPAKNNTFWTESNTGYAFVPSSGPSRYVSSQLLTLAGSPVVMADTATTVNGLLDLAFPDVCVSGSSTQFIVRTTYSACDNPATQLVSDDTITVNLSGMQADVTPAATSCNGASNGTITIEPTTGTGPFSYSLDGGTPVSGGSPFTFNNIPAGVHTIVATDAFGCVTQPITVTVDPGPAITTNVNKTDALCNGSATGTITVDQPPGSAPFSYSLDGTNWQASPVFTSLAAGTYTVYYREGNGCQGSQSITIAQPTAMTVAANSAPVVCNGESNGVINVFTSGGVSPYEYSIDGGTNWQTSNSFNVSAGNYTVTIRDVNGCTTTEDFIINEPAPLLAQSLNSNASCDGGNDGSITVTANGGNSGYQYSLDGNTFQSSNVFNVIPGNYTVTVKDMMDCVTSFNTTVGLTSNLTFTPQIDPIICEGKSTQLELISNGTDYSWSPAIGLDNPSISNPVANPVTTTEYIVTTTLGFCSEKDTVIVNVNAAPIPNAGSDGYICFGQTYQLQGTGGTQYSWSPSTYLDNTDIPNPVSSAPKDMTYTLSILSDVNGCASLVTDDMRLDVTPPIKVKTYPFDTVVYNSDKFQLYVTTNDSDVINYNWWPVRGLDNPNIADPFVTAGDIGDVIQYQVTTSTIAGCKGFGYVTVKVYKGPDLYVPTGFTPNNDGKNDRFTPFPVGIEKLNYFRVFNRWGNLLFSTNQLNYGWDGRFQGTEQPSGTYVWMAEGVTLDGRVITKKGTVTLIR